MHTPPGCIEAIKRDPAVSDGERLDGQVGKSAGAVMGAPRVGKVEQQRESLYQKRIERDLVAPRWLLLALEEECPLQVDRPLDHVSPSPAHSDRCEEGAHVQAEKDGLEQLRNDEDRADGGAGV